MEKILVACIIENDKGELLLQKKTLDYPTYPGKWCLFGGEAESEDLYKEMKRELEEEIGIEIPIKLIFNQEVILEKRKLPHHIFSAKLNDISKIKIGEGAGIAFFGREELKDLNIPRQLKDILNKYFKEFKN